MYRILLFAALFSTVLFTNCKKDKTVDELIVGKWNVTKLIADGEDIIQGDPDYKTKLVLEFTSTGTVVFNITELDLTTTPATENTFTVAGTYAVTGDDQLSITVTDGSDVSNSTGTATIKSNHLSFTATNAGAEEFIASMEADKQ